MSVITIAADLEASTAGALRWVVASLPASLDLVADKADVRAVTGTAGWARRAEQALRDGAAGVVVIAPEMEPVAGLRAVAAEKDAFVILDQQWRSNAVLDDARSAVSNLEAPFTFAEITVNASETASLDRAAVESLQIAEHVFGGVNTPRLLHRQAHSVLLGASLAGDAPLTISLAVGPVYDCPFRLRVVTVLGSVLVSLPDAETAAPALVTIVHADGATTRPMRWESAHRASWRRAITAFENRDRPDDLGEYDQASRLFFDHAACG